MATIHDNTALQKAMLVAIQKEVKLKHLSAVYLDVFDKLSADMFNNPALFTLERLTPIVKLLWRSDVTHMKESVLEF